MVVGYLQPPLPDGSFSVQELATITFSPQQFKATALSFAQTIAAYEAAFGPIVITQQPLTQDEMKKLVEDAVARTRQPLR